MAEEAVNTEVKEEGVSTEEASPNETLTAETEAQPDGSADDKTVQGAPEQYEFTFPDGVEKDDALLEEFTPLAKELNLSQENAQKLVDFHTKWSKATHDRDVGAWESLQKEWVNATKADKEVGGHDHLSKLAVAKKAFDVLEPDDKTALVNLFNFTGVGNHVAMVKFLYKVGTMMAEDKVVTGNSSSSEPRDAAKILFPDMA